MALGHNGQMTERHEFGIDSVLDGDTAIVSVRGELDLATKPLLLKELRSAVAGGAKALVIDVSGLSFVDSTGVGAFLEARQLGASVMLRNPKGRVRKLLDLVLIDTVVPIEYGPDQA
jgi:anti-sigma B factor antagonist